MPTCSVFTVLYVPTPQRYNRWKANHVARGECTINFEGTSGMMEVEADVVLWSRSVEKHWLRCVTMLLHKHLEPIYKRLTSDDLLKRCELKATQNPSESFHHSVWSRCSNKNLHSLPRVEFAVISAAAEYNRGPAAISTVKRALSFETGEYGRKFERARAHKRVLKSSVEEQQKEQKRRKLCEAAVEKARLEKEAEEGGPAYQAEMF
ncbi:opioid growth factor receptor [Plakobranchus ocellatus]|uniref:Opioid growth factor receptor n=1 Tax=Plakobranchus ocellatus TaxID=259542 RepID=A0AAV4DIQ7_9GAST|nr:opioid growth factor receptor [Plakobranchus ocellatus]